MSAQSPFFCVCLYKKLLDFSSQLLELIDSRSLGKNINVPISTRSIHEVLVQKSLGRPEKTVEALINQVKSMIDIINAMTMYVILLIFPVCNPPHNMTGNVGNTHGARIVSIHAIKDVIYNDISLVQQINKSLFD